MSRIIPGQHIVSPYLIPILFVTVVMEDSTCIAGVSGWYLILVLLVVCIFLACLCGLSSHVGCM
jgi:hypothetical protein